MRTKRSLANLAARALSELETLFRRRLKGAVVPAQHSQRIPRRDEPRSRQTEPPLTRSQDPLIAFSLLDPEPIT